MDDLVFEAFGVEQRARWVSFSPGHHHFLHPWGGFIDIGTDGKWHTMNYNCPSTVEVCDTLEEARSKVEEWCVWLAGDG